MSEPTIIKDIENAGHAVINYIKGNSIIRTLENGAKAAEAELKTLAPADLEKAVEAIGVAALGVLTGGGSEEAAIAAGIAAALPAFEAAEKDITAKTTNTLVSSVVTQLQAQQASNPAPAPAPPAA